MVFNDYDPNVEKCDLPFNIDCSTRSKLRKYNVYCQPTMKLITIPFVHFLFQRSPSQPCTAGVPTVTLSMKTQMFATSSIFVLMESLMPSLVQLAWYTTRRLVSALGLMKPRSRDAWPKVRYDIVNSLPLPFL